MTRWKIIGIDVEKHYKKVKNKVMNKYLNLPKNQNDKLREKMLY